MKEFDVEERKALLSKRFVTIFKKDKASAIALLKEFDAQECKTLLSTHFTSIFHSDQASAIALLKGLDMQERKALLLTYFGYIFYRDQASAIALLKGLDMQERKALISTRFGSIFNSDNAYALELLKEFDVQENIDKVIIDNFKKIVHNNKKLVIKLFSYISSYDKKIIISKKYFYTTGDSEKEFISLVKEIKNEIYFKKVILDLIPENLEFNIQKTIRLLKSFDVDSHIINKYKTRTQSILSEIFNKTKTEVYHMQNIENREIYNYFLERRSLNIFFTTNKLTENLKNDDILEILLKIEKPLMFKLLIKMLISRLGNLDNRSEYSELLFKVISQNKIKNGYSHELVEYIDNTYFYNSALEYIEIEKAKNDVRKILNKIKTEKKQGSAFIKAFKEKYPIKYLYGVIATVAQKDFTLAMELLKSVKNAKYEQIAIEETFLALYKTDLSAAVLCYERINYFPKKVELSRRVINEKYTFIKESFIGKFVNTISTQNIANTPYDLAIEHFEEVLEFYNPNKVQKTKLEETIDKLFVYKDDLENAKQNKDTELYKKVMFDITTTKENIQEDKDLYREFLETYNIDEFTFETTNILEFLV